MPGSHYCFFWGSGYLVVRVLQVYPRQIVFFCYLFVLVAAFAFLKQYAFLKAILPDSLFQRTVALVGLSYLLFRQIHVLAFGCALQGQIETPFPLWNYLNYQLNTFLACWPVLSSDTRIFARTGCGSLRSFLTAIVSLRLTCVYLLA